MHDRARAATTRSERGRRGRPEPPWTDHGHVATGEPQIHDRLRGSPVDLADHSIRIEPSLRLSPEADAPGLTRGDFRRFLAVMERALNIASDRPGAPGTGLWLAAGSMRSGRRDGSTPEVPGGGCGDGNGFGGCSLVRTVSGYRIKKRLI